MNSRSRAHKHTSQMRLNWCEKDGSETCSKRDKESEAKERQAEQESAELKHNRAHWLSCERQRIHRQRRRRQQQRCITAADYAHNVWMCVCVQERNGISSTHTQRPMRTSCYVLCLKRIQSAVIRSNVSTSTKAALFDFVGSISGIPHIWTLTFCFDRLLIKFGFVVIFMCCANDFFNFVHQRKINIERRNGTSWTRTSK